MSDFARVFEGDRYGQMLVVKVPYLPKIEVHVEVSGVRVIMTVDFSNVTTKQPYRAQDKFWATMNAPDLQILLDEYRNMSPVLENELRAARYEENIDPNFIWKPTNESN